MILTATGHRPDKLGGYDVFAYQRAYHRLVDLARAGLRACKATELNSGMAQGWDTACAIAAIEEGITLNAFIPFPGQELRWPRAAQKTYERLLLLAATVNTISPEIPEGSVSAAMQRRNMAMVDRGDEMLALWNGSPGGTANCLAYARQKGKRIVNLWSSWEKYA